MRDMLYAVYGVGVDDDAYSPTYTYMLYRKKLLLPDCYFLLEEGRHANLDKNLTKTNNNRKNEGTHKTRKNIMKITDQKNLGMGGVKLKPMHEKYTICSFRV